MPAGFQMQTELLGGSFDYQKLSDVTQQVVKAASSNPQLQHVSDDFRPGAPQVTVTVDRDRAETLRVSVGDVFSTLIVLSRIDLRQSVQQIRTGIPSLCPGRFEVSLQTGRSVEPLCYEPGQADGADRRDRASRHQLWRRR